MIPFNIVGTTSKLTTENFNHLSHACKNTCFGIYQAQVTMVFSVMLTFITLIVKTNFSDPLKRENFWRETLITMAPYGLNIEEWKLALFILPICCNLWIIGTASFSGLELWKMNLFSHYFINFSFTFLFIFTSIITMLTVLLLLLLFLLLF